MKLKVIWFHEKISNFKSKIPSNCYVHSVEIIEFLRHSYFLREINFKDIRGPTAAILAHLEAVNFDFYYFLQFLMVEIDPNSKFRGIFWTSRTPGNWFHVAETSWNYLTWNRRKNITINHGFAPKIPWNKQHSVENPTFFCHSDFTWNQFWSS